jgi:hypothetical protein
MRTSYPVVIFAISSFVAHANSSHAAATDDQEMVLHGMTQLNTVSFCRNIKRSGLVHVEKGMDVKTYR